ncbi:MAG: amidohydrolase [Pyramidobacter sp.]|uniref:M20 metallopeptidase family protein n=1 Tax=Pyramidobacter sp. TaxID=1943581 RepID=UPI0025DC00D5|nr:amidohydrolase [Pyramidobacter sp.]MCI7403548.1 amidohydrolase [Pyramidobacter sp.]
MDMKEIEREAAAYEGVVRAHRRALHRIPELGYSEQKTQAYILKELQALAPDEVRVFAQTGVRAVFRGNGQGRVVAFRADIDALPVKEETGCAFASEHPGFMHACGHDGHMAMLLGAARMLCEARAQLRGSVRLIFQPSEESADFVQGARAVVEDGRALDGVDAIFGAHLWSPLPSGVLGWRAGPMMACSDSWTVKLRGQGGHGASPHQTHDPTVAAAQLICALQTFVSRELDPQKSAVLSTGVMKAGGAFNVIPSEAELTGTARSFEPQISRDCEAFIRRMAENIGAAFRCTAELDYRRNLPPTVNDAEMARLGAETGRGIFGADMVREVPPTMGGEDFSFYLEKIPGAFFFIGCGDAAKGSDWPHHHCKFTIDESQLCKGAAFEAACAWAFLNQ